MNARLAIAGLGIAVLPDVVAREAVMNGELQKILPQWRSVEVPIYAITATRLIPIKTQVFIDFVAEKITEWHQSS